MHKSEGMNKYTKSIPVLTLSPIQSMVVVTSPIGEKAPPAFAAIMINPANQILSSLFLMIFCKIEINTIVAVKLSIIADKIKASIENIHKSFFLLLKFTYPLMVEKPLK